MELKIKLYLNAIIIVDGHKKLIAFEKCEEIYSLIQETMEKQACLVLAMGSTENHVHILFDLNPDVSIDEVLKKVKLSTQTKIRHSLNPDFLWDDGYYAYSIGVEDIEKEKYGISLQEIKHQNISLAEELQKLREGLQMNESDELTDINENSFN